MHRDFGLTHYLLKNAMHRKNPLVPYPDDPIHSVCFAKKENLSI